MEAGLESVLEKGYNNTGLNEVLSRAAVPKGSFYHFFKSKEEFCLEVLSAGVRPYDEAFERQVSDTARPPLVRLRELFDGAIAHHEQRRCRGGCVVGNLSLEMSDQNESVRRVADATLNRWQGYFTSLLKEARERGDLSPDVDCEEMAGFILDAWEGALLRMKASKSIEPTRRFLRIVIDGLLRAR